MTIPNQLSLARLFITPVPVILLFTNIPNNELIALGIFAIAAASDVLDGYVARKFKMESPLGRYLDQLADKILNITMLVTILYLNVVPLWIVLILLARDLVVESFLNVAISKKLFFKSLYPGKLKSLFVTIAILFGILSLAMYDGLAIGNFRPEDLANAANFSLILSFILGFMGSTALMSEMMKKLSSKY